MELTRDEIKALEVGDFVRYRFTGGDSGHVVAIVVNKDTWGDVLTNVVRFENASDLTRYNLAYSYKLQGGWFILDGYQTERYDPTPEELAMAAAMRLTGNSLPLDFELGESN